MLDFAGFWVPTWGGSRGVLLDLGSQHGGVKGGTRMHFSSLCWILGLRWAKIAPRALQEAPKSPPRAAQEPPTSLQDGLGDRCLLDF